MSTKTSKQTYAPSLLANFKKLHEAFTSLMALQPWTIVHESVMLGVQHPENNEIYYAYFMGELGEVVGFNLYRGENVAPWLLAREHLDEPDFSYNELLTHTFYQLASSKKTGLPAPVKELYAAASITIPRGKSGYLEPITYQGGFTPEMMDEAQMAEVSPLIPGFIYLLENIANGKLNDAEELSDKHFCYIAVLESNGVWHETIRQLPEPEEINLFEINPPDPSKWIGLKMLPKAREPFIIHTHLLPTPTMSNDGIGIFPLAILCIGAESKMIIGFQLLDVRNWKNEAAPMLLKTLQDVKLLPIAFHVADENSLPLAESCAQLLGIDVGYDEDAAVLLDEIFDSLSPVLGF